MLIQPTTNVDNWEEYCAHNFQFTDPVGFMMGMEETTNHVERLLEKTASYEELKSELLAYISDREIFLKQAKDVYTSGNFQSTDAFKMYTI